MQKDFFDLYVGRVGFEGCRLEGIHESSHLRRKLGLRLILHVLLHGDRVDEHVLRQDHGIDETLGPEVEEVL